MTYGQNLISFMVKHNINDAVLVLVVKFAGEEEPVSGEVFP
jgi:hypothetical protein